MTTRFVPPTLFVAILLGALGCGAPGESSADGTAPATNAGTPAPANAVPEGGPVANEATMANVPGSATNAATNAGVPVPTKADVEKQLAEVAKTYDEQIARATDPKMRSELERAKENALKAMRAAMTAAGTR